MLCVRHDIISMLTSVSSKAKTGGIIGVLKGRNLCSRSVSIGLEMLQFEETTIKTMHNSNAIK